MLSASTSGRGGEWGTREGRRREETDLEQGRVEIVGGLCVKRSPASAGGRWEGGTRFREETQGTHQICLGVFGDCES